MAGSTTALSIRTRRGKWPPIFAALAASALDATPVRADSPPLRIDYHAAPGCPNADVFLDEIRWRTRLARAAAPGEEPLPVRARITRHGAVSSGHLILGQGESRILRDIEGERCDEVVSALRLSAEVAGTGGFDVGQGGVWFLRGIGRVEGCAFAARPAPWLALVPCLGVEGGALHAEGILRGSLASVERATIFWRGAGALPRIGADLGSWVLDLQGGPIFPAVRRSFVFENPAYVISTLPPVTWTVALGAGAHFL
jgi:hypothetical protein